MEYIITQYILYGHFYNHDRHLSSEYLENHCITTNLIWYERYHENINTINLYDSILISSIKNNSIEWYVYYYNKSKSKSKSKLKKIIKYLFCMNCFTKNDEMNPLLDKTLMCKDIIYYDIKK